MKEQIAEYVISLCRDIPMAVYEGLLSVLCFGTVVIIVCYGLKRGWRGIAGLLLTEYIFLIYCSTVIYRKGSEWVGHDFSPFWSYTAIQEGREEVLVENVMNVVTFVPVGLLLGTAMRCRSVWSAMLVGVGLSVGIETLQFVFKKGFAETDDVIHNTLGCMIGYGVYSIGRYGIERITKKSMGVLNIRKLE